MTGPEAAALLLVDIQPDFMPGGALAVAGGDGIIAPVAALMESGRFRCCVATQDWHPPGHVSFASRHPGHKPFDTVELYGHEQTLWPDHCVQDMPGAQLHPDLPMTKIDDHPQRQRPGSGFLQRLSQQLERGWRTSAHRPWRLPA